MDFIQEFFKYFDEDSNEISLEAYSKIIPAIDQWLALNKVYTQKILEKNKRLSNDILNREKKETMNKMKITKKRLNYAIKNIEGDVFEEIANHFKKGYILLHRIRTFFTGQEIEYKILMGKEKGSVESTNLYEINFSMEELLNFVSIDVTGRTFQKDEKIDLMKMERLRIEFEAVSEKYNSQENAWDKTKIQLLEKPTLWETLVAQRNKWITEKIFNRYSENWGRTYEVYKILTLTPKYDKINAIGHYVHKKNTIDLAKSLFEDQRGENVKGWQMGDYGLQQFKAIFNSLAGLINTSSLVNTLEKIREVLSNKWKKQIKDGLKSIFLAKFDETKIYNKLSIELTKEAEENIDKIIKNKKIKIRKVVL